MSDASGNFTSDTCGKKLEKRCCNYQLKQAYTSKAFHPETDSRIKYSTFQLLHFSLIQGSDNQMTENVNSIQLPSIHIMVWISIIMICIFRNLCVIESI